MESGSSSKPELSRAVGFWGAVWMGLGSILGTGVFVSLGIAAGVVGSGLVIAVALAALVATANGLSSAQLAAAHPVSGGTYEYGYKYLHPAAGFMAGWMFLLAKSASAATAALGFSGYLLHTLNLPKDTPSRVGIALGLVAALTLLVRSGIRRSASGNSIIVGLTLITLILFVVIGVQSASVLPIRYDLLVGFLGDALTSIPSLLEATALMFVAYTGYGRIATLGEEMKEPAKNIPPAIVTTLLISMVLYLSVAAVALSSAGAPSFAEAAEGGAAPLEVVARGFPHPWVSRVVAVGAVTAMAGVLLNLILGLSRVLLAMARRGDAPRYLAEVSPKSQSPNRAVVAVGIVIAGLVLAGDVKTTWSFSAFTVLIYYGITNLAALRLPESERRFPKFISRLGLLSCFGLAFFVEWKIWLAGMVLLLLGFVFRTMLRL